MQFVDCMMIVDGMITDGSLIIISVRLLANEYL